MLGPSSKTSKRGMIWFSSSSREPTAQDMGRAMVVERASTRSVADVLDRVLDKGIVVEGWRRFLLAGLDLIHLDVRMVVTSIDTYLTRVGALAMTNAASRRIWIELPRKARAMRRRSPTRTNRVV